MIVAVSCFVQCMSQCRTSVSFKFFNCWYQNSHFKTIITITRLKTTINYLITLYFIFLLFSIIWYFNITVDKQSEVFLTPLYLQITTYNAMTNIKLYYYFILMILITVFNFSAVFVVFQYFWNTVNIYLESRKKPGKSVCCIVGIKIYFAARRRLLNMSLLIAMEESHFNAMIKSLGMTVP